MIKWSVVLMRTVTVFIWAIIGGMLGYYTMEALIALRDHNDLFAMWAFALVGFGVVFVQMWSKL